MERWHAKVLALLILFCTVLIATLLPIKVTKYFVRQGRRGQLVLSYFMCFGGGVFLSTYALHMAPDVREIIHHTIKEPNGITYPIADLMILGGMFSMLFLEKFLEKLNKRRSSNKESLDHKESNGCTSTEDGVPLRSVNGVMVAEDSVSEGSIPPEPTGVRSLLLLLALSLDHIFEGMSVGLKHSVTSVWNLTFAIIAHEVVIAFSLGMRLVKSYSSIRKVVAAALLCSAMEPLGVTIGMILMEVGGADNPHLFTVNGVLQAMSTGVFMYATFFEILSDELQGNTSIIRLCFMLLGFIVLALMALIPEENPLAIGDLIANSTTWSTTSVPDYVTVT